MSELNSSAWNPVRAVVLIALAGSLGSAPLAWTYATGNYVWAVAVSRDGRYAIAGSDDMHTYFFDIASVDGKPLWSYTASGYVRDVAVSEDGRLAAVSDADGNIFFFREAVTSGVPVWSYQSGSGIEALAMSTDGGYLVVGDKDGSLYLFRTDLAEPLVWQYDIPGGIMSVALSKSGAVAATAARGGLYFFGAVSSGSREAWVFKDYTSFPCLVMDKDRDLIVVGGSDGYVYLVDSKGQLVDQQRLGGGVSSLAISDLTHSLLAGSTNGNVSLYLIQDRLETLGSVETQRPVTSVVLSENEERLAIAYVDGRITMFSQSLTSQMWTFNAGATVHALSMSDDGRVTAAGTDAYSIYLFNEKSSAPTDRPGLNFVPVFLTVIGLLVAYFVWRRKKTQVALN